MCLVSLADAHVDVYFGAGLASGFCMEACASGYSLLTRVCCAVIHVKNGDR